MKKEGDIVIINGKKYSKVTGELLGDTEKDVKSQKSKTAQSFHSLAKKSQTLYRSAVKKPLTIKNALNRKIGRSMDIAKSSAINRFHKPVAKPTPKTTNYKDSPNYAKHPLATKTSEIIQRNKQLSAVQSKLKTSKEMLEAARQKAISQLSNEISKKPKDRKRFNLIITAISIAILLVAGFIATYYLIPSITVSIAGSKAGVEARYPKYVPDGYRLKRPIRQSEGNVMIDFVANTGDSHFTLSQRKSTWDSTAVKDSIEEEADNNLKTINERGLTIFIYKYNAAWVNGGIYYQIQGNAPLSSEQILRIVASL